MKKYILKQRIHDIYSGAIGKDWKDDDDFADAENLSNILPALRDVFAPEKENEWIFGNRLLSYFIDVESATDHLWESLFKNVREE
jgi:hypothetical protein